MTSPAMLNFPAPCSSATRPPIRIRGWSSPPEPVTSDPDPWSSPTELVTSDPDPWSSPTEPVTSDPDPWSSPPKPVTSDPDPWSSPTRTGDLRSGSVKLPHPGPWSIILHGTISHPDGTKTHLDEAL